FKSPGTGKTLSKKHECCVYLVDQGVFQVQGRISKLSEDGQETELETWFEDDLDGSLSILDRICMELNVLGEGA
ncbi:hypothetical protein BGZ65_006403, partial [Modicella reniformis]